MNITASFDWSVQQKYYLQNNKKKTFDTTQISYHVVQVSTQGNWFHSITLKRVWTKNKKNKAKKNNRERIQFTICSIITNWSFFQRVKKFFNKKCSSFIEETIGKAVIPFVIVLNIFLKSIIIIQLIQHYLSEF